MRIHSRCIVPFVVAQSLGLAQPVITAPPSDRVAYLGEAATLRVSATGTPPVTYQWSINGVTLEGETAPDLNLASLTPQDQGDYAVVVADGTGSVSPPPVRLMVIPHDLVAGRGWEIRLGTPEMVPWETSNEDGNPSVASDGLTLTFSSRRAGGRGGWDLWTASRPSRSSTWGRPVNLGPSVNSAQDEDNSRLSADGLTLYFDSTRAGGSGAHDLWMATRTSLTNSFGPPVNLGPGINSESDDGGPAISADGLTLVFVSYRSGFGGPGDLWISTRTDIRASWEPARLMPETVNSSAIEVTPALSDDGLTLVYMSNRNGQGALWITRRTDRADEFGPPLIIQRLVDEGMASDYPSLSADGLTLFFNIYPNGFFEGTPELWQTSLQSLPILRLGSAGGATPRLSVTLEGRPHGRYDLEGTTDLKTWTREGTVQLGEQTNAIPYQVLPPDGQRRFLRARAR